MTNILPFTGITKHDISAQSMLRAIATDEPSHAFVIAWPSGGMPTYHSSTADMPVILMRLQEFIHKYYNGDFDEVEK